MQSRPHHSSWMGSARQGRLRRLKCQNSHYPPSQRASVLAQWTAFQNTRKLPFFFPFSNCYMKIVREFFFCHWSFLPGLYFSPTDITFNQNVTNCISPSGSNVETNIQIIFKPKMFLPIIKDFKKVKNCISYISFLILFKALLIPLGFGLSLG